ncbi:MAG TPA: hypothetical protein VG796_10995 [Verrucomicrobiales bacterium]|nr:hypothetical protein [Verrucomicrobiales bacterium]
MKRIPVILLFSALTVAAADPSTKPLTDPSGKTKYAERYRTLADLDGDGADDLLLSEARLEFGKMGGSWTVYLNRKGEYSEIGTITAKPGAITIEPDRARSRKNQEEKFHARIWVYLRGGAGAGSFGYFRVGEKSVEKLRSLELYPGDAGTSLSNAVYEAAFKKKSPVEFRVERSTTDANGTVHWNAEKTQ